jgi:hypothetical protein
MTAMETWACDGLDMILTIETIGGYLENTHAGNEVVGLCRDPGVTSEVVDTEYFKKVERGE